MTNGRPINATNANKENGPLFSAKTFAKLQLSSKSILKPTTRAAIIAALMTGPLAASAMGLEVPTAPNTLNEFQVNTITLGAQENPDIAMDSDGDFVVVWSSNYPNSLNIKAQRYNSEGTPQGGEIQVNTYTTSAQSWPTVAMDADGDFVVVWQSYGSEDDDSDGYSIQGQRFDNTGTPQGDQFQINTYITDNQIRPEVAMDDAGNFVVVWQSYGSSSGDTFYSIQAKRFTSTGTPQGIEFQVNTITTDLQIAPSVAMDSDGDFVVVWESYYSSTDPDLSIQAQRYDSTGSTQGVEFQVNSYTTSSQIYPSVAMNSAGDFVVVWNSYGSGGTDADFSIQGQLFNANGVAQGSEFQVNTFTFSTQANQAVAMDNNGDFVVVWESDLSDGSDAYSRSVRGQRFSSIGEFQGSPFQLNTYTTNRQENARVAMDSAGNFVAVWQSQNQDGSSWSVHGAGDQASDHTIFIPVIITD